MQRLPKGLQAHLDFSLSQPATTAKIGYKMTLKRHRHDLEAETVSSYRSYQVSNNCMGYCVVLAFVQPVGFFEFSWF